MKTISKNKLRKIELDVTESGFTLWITESVNEMPRKHWLIDASHFRDDGEIRLGGSIDHYKFEAVYDEKGNKIRLINKG